MATQHQIEGGGMDSKSTESEVRRLLAPLKAERAELSDRQQAAIWARIEAEHQAPATTGWRWAAAAAVVLAAGGVWWTVSSDSTAVQPDPTVPSAAPIAKHISDRSLTLPSGAQITVEGDVTVATATRVITRLRLTRGRIASTVPSLPADGRYVIDTPTAEIEVRGTVFSVALGDEAVTTVQVTEGEVEVRARDGRQLRRLTAGETTIIEPTSMAGATRAEARGDLTQAFDIRRALLEQGPDDLSRRNRFLSLGHTIDAQAKALSVGYWERIEQLHPAGTHADEYAYRHAAALREAGRIDAARRVARRFRSRFPASPRAAETLGW
jgi:hypothetical protein